jgi:hypothetical protein
LWTGHQFPLSQSDFYFKATKIADKKVCPYKYCHYKKEAALHFNFGFVYFY